MKLLALLPYLLTAAGLFSTLALFLTLKHDVRRHTQRFKARIEEMMARIDVAQRVAESAPRIVDQEPAMILVPAQPRAGLNLNKRVHAMRMLRRGEDVNHIAAALGVPRREVELMIRVSSFSKVRAAAAD